MLIGLEEAARTQDVPPRSHTIESFTEYRADDVDLAGEQGIGRGVSSGM